MAEAGDEWELSKENVQPLRQGRAMSTLQEVLSQQESSHHHAIQQQKQTFELELRFYNGDDPLDVWDRYIKWAEQAFPQGGKESNLSPLLERAVKIFHEDKRYYDDLRYLNICLKFANCCTEPADLYSYLHSQGIGLLHAQLYITWAEEYEARGNFKKADSIYQDGLQRRAEPMDRLEASHKQFQARVSRQILQGLADGDVVEESESSEAQRNSLVDLKARGKNKARAPVSRVGDAIKRTSQRFGAPMAPPQQIPSRARFAVFDENAGTPVPESQPTLAAQPWPALPPTRAKENEQKAGPWNSGRPPRSTHQTSGNDPTPSLPSFTPYVDEMAEQQTVTPCKINPSVTSVLSARKPSKEEDPLQRLQGSAQGKEEMVMYCKNKIYAGMEEFSIEEIRAEIYMAKVRKKREEDLLASALRRQEMEKQIEELEKRLKGSCTENQEQVNMEAAPAEGTNEVPGTMESEPQSGQDTMFSDCTPSDKHEDPEPFNIPTLLLPSDEVLSLDQNKPKSTNLSSTLSTDVPFTIFDETFESQHSTTSENMNRLPRAARRPLAVVSKSLVVHEDVPLTDTLDGIEPLNEEAIVSGSDRNKTLFAEPEDTCDFVRAAQLASTPFHKVKDESEENDTPNLGRLPLREKTPVYEESFQQVVCPKKLSPILEASREDTPSSVSSVSTGSSSMFTLKTLFTQEKFDPASQMSGVYEQALDCSVDLEELHKNLLLPISELLKSKPIHQEAGQMPSFKDQEEIHLGDATYRLKSEVGIGERSNLFIATLPDLEMDGSMKGVVIKVYSQPVPWDFYITQQLSERLGEVFSSYFIEQNECFLFQDGCFMIYKDITCFTIQDILENRETLTEEVIILFAYNLLSLVEKLHSVEIVHGDLRTESLLLDNKIFDLPSCTEMNGCIKPIDFSHSMDMRLCSNLPSRAFPIAQTQYGQQVLAGRTSPYQVDILCIANLVHLMIFSKSLQVHNEDSLWKISKEIPRLWRGELWNSFFSKILNTDRESTAVLKELKGEMEQLLDSSFQDELCNYFIELEIRLSPPI